MRRFSILLCGGALLPLIGGCSMTGHAGAAEKPVAAEAPRTEAHDGPTPEDQWPLTVLCDGSPIYGVAPLTVQFRCESQAPGEAAEKATYAVNYQDGSKGKGAMTMHTFKKPGRYTVEFVATTSDGRSATDEVIIDVDARE